IAWPGTTPSLLPEPYSTDADYAHGRTIESQPHGAYSAQVESPGAVGAVELRQWRTDRLEHRLPILFVCFAIHLFELGEFLLQWRRNGGKAAHGSGCNRAVARDQ